MNEKQKTSLAVWSTAFVNNLPDSAFLYIEPGGKKDSAGKTVPRSLRHFPYKDASRKIDLPHLRDAIGRIPQSKLPANIKNAVQAKARKILAGLNKTKQNEKIDDPCVLTFDSAEVEMFGDSPTSPNAEKNNIRLHLYDGSIIQHPYWGNLAFELSTMSLQKPVVPILVDHTDPIAVSTGANFQNEFILTGKFLKNNAEAKVVKSNMDDGLPYEASLRFDPRKSKMEVIPEGGKGNVNGIEIPGPGTIFRDTKVKEGSVCLFGQANNCKSESFNFLNERKDVMPDEKAELDASAIGAEALAAERTRMTEIKKAFPDDAAFALEQIEKGDSVLEAKAAYGDKLKEKLAASEKKNTELQEKAAGKASADKLAGNAIKAGDDSGDGSQQSAATEDFMTLSRQYVKDNKCSMTDAMKHIAAEKSEVHQAFLDKASQTKVRVSGKAKRVA